MLNIFFIYRILNPVHAGSLEELTLKQNAGQGATIEECNSDGITWELQTGNLSRTFELRSRKGESRNEGNGDRKQQNNIRGNRGKGL